jgi:pimeloyl-ACP methyl ester carboxylesterase
VNSKNYIPEPHIHLKIQSALFCFNEYRLQILLTLTVFFSVSCSVFGQTGDSLLKVYLFPGQGSDYRLFSKLDLGKKYDTIYIHYPVAERNISLEDYSKLLIRQIDTSGNFILIGVSLGGMICTELTDILHPAKTIIISSAKQRSELPFRYRILKTLPIYLLIPAGLIKAGAFVAQPIVEPDRKLVRDTCIHMLKAKSPAFLKQSITMIVKWKRTTSNDAIIHIHGTHDHTIPFRRINADYSIENGSHFMILTRSEEINKLILFILDGTHG